MRFFCIGFRCRNDVAICINLYLRGCIIHFRKYGLPYGLSDSLCTLHLIVTNFDATLSMGGWLDLTQQGLSPCKKYKTSWRSSAKSYRNIDLAPPSPVLLCPYLFQKSSLNHEFNFIVCTHVMDSDIWIFIFENTEYFIYERLSYRYDSLEI